VQEFFAHGGDFRNTGDSDKSLTSFEGSRLANPGGESDLLAMKRIAILLLASGVLCSAETVTLTKSAIIKADRSIVSVKAGATVELISRDDKNQTVTVRYNNKITGTIPASAIDAAVDAPKTAEPAPVVAPTPAPAPRKMETNYGRAVEKAKENAAKHDKNVAKPVDAVLQN
jgi:hypothetical protein